MDFICQRNQKETLSRFAQADRHTILIEGPKGSGKTFLAHHYANILNIDDCVEIEPKVATVKESIEQCINTDNRVAIIIENLDTGVLAASYALLKFIEEPLSNIYIVITCRNLDNVPSTILSRSFVVSTVPPTQADLEQFATSIDYAKFNAVKDKRVWSVCRTFSDADCILKMSATQAMFYETIDQQVSFNKDVSSIVWNISHYSDGTECNVELSIRCIMDIFRSTFVTQCGVDCMRDLSSGRIARHSVLSKFVFNIKYCE